MVHEETKSKHRDMETGRLPAPVELKAAPNAIGVCAPRNDQKCGCRMGCSRLNFALIMPEFGQAPFFSRKVGSVQHGLRLQEPVKPQVSKSVTSAALWIADEWRMSTSIGWRSPYPATSSLRGLIF